MMLEDESYWTNRINLLHRSNGLRRVRTRERHASNLDYRAENQRTSFARHEQMRLRANRGSGNRDSQLGSGKRAKRKWLPQRSHRQMRKQRGHTQHHAQQNHRRVCSQLTQIERGTKPDKKQWTQKAFSHREKLFGQSPRLTHRGDHQAERKSGQHNRNVVQRRQRSQREQDS